MPQWWEAFWPVAAGAVGGLLAVWVVLVALLWFRRPDELSVRDGLRLLPDLLRLLRRLAADEELPRGVRVRLVLLLAYLAMPFDLVPDFVPVLGYADDVVAVVLVLRSVVRASGAEAVSRHWPGTPEGLAAVRRLARM